jgi:hypothetical protein
MRLEKIAMQTRTMIADTAPPINPVGHNREKGRNIKALSVLE